MHKPDLSIYDNADFNPGRNRFVRTVWYFVNSWLLQAYWLPISSVKVTILRLFGATIGKGVVIKPNINVKYPWHLEVGNHTWIGEGVWVDNLTKVEIGSHCCISQGALLFCGNHNFKKISFDLMVNKIVLEDGSWVGANATVCPGVTLYENSILTAGSTATSDLSINGIYQGNPAKRIKERLIHE